MSRSESYKYPRKLKVPGKGTKSRRIWDGCIAEMGRLGWVAEDLSVRGTVTSARFVFYRLESQGIVPKAYYDASGREKSRMPSMDVSDQLRDLREMAVLSLDSIVDEGRGQESYTGWSDLYEGAEESVKRVRLDPWTNDECVDGGAAPHLWVESGSLLTIVRPIASRFRVPVVAAKGQASMSLCWELAQRTPDGATILYLGDLDLSGGHIESSLVDRTAAFYNDTFDVERLAITEEQVARYGLTVMSKYDRRSKTHNDAVETEALGQDRIKTIVTDRLAELLRTSTQYGTIEDVEVTEREQRRVMVADLFQ
jgi:hypothetical protein